MTTVISVTSGQNTPNISVTSGEVLSVYAGGTATNALIENGGSAVIFGADSGSTILAGGIETVSGGSALGDTVYGTLIESLSGSVISGATIMSGGVLSMNVASGSASAITVDSGGQLIVAANAPATNTVLSGGTLLLESGKASVSGTLTMNGSSTIEETTNISAGYGEAAVINGFAAGDLIYFTAIASANVLTSSVNGAGNTVVSVTSGSTTETLVFSGTYGAGAFTLTNNTASGVQITANGWLPPVPITVSSGVTSTGLTITSGVTLSVLAGGSAVNATVELSGTANIAGSDSGLVVQSGGNALVTGTETSATIQAGGNENMSGTATGDAIYGTQLISAATAVVTSETVYAGGTIELFLKGAQANGTIISGGTLAISGNAFASNTVLSSGVVEFESAKASLDGTFTFAGAGGYLETTGLTSTGSGDLAVIQGFAAGDAIEIASVGAGATLSTALSGGNTVVTVSGGALLSNGAQSFIFSGTNWTDSGTLVMSQTTSGGVIGEEIVYSAGVLIVGSGASSSGEVVSAGLILEVASGGNVTGASILAGGSATIAGSGSDDKISGTETVTGAVSNETVASGGSLVVSGTASGITISGGTVDLATSGAELTGSLTFNGSGTLVVGAVASAGAGDLAVISGFGAGDVIDVTILGAGPVVTSAVSGGNTVVTVAGGGGSESFVFAGASYGVAGDFVLSGNDLAFSANTGNTAYVSSGQAAPADYVVSGGYVLDVLAGGSATGASVLAGGEIVVAGSAANTDVALGGSESVTGTVSGEEIYGSQIVSGSASGDTIETGGSATIVGSATGDTVYGAETISGTATNVTVNGGSVSVVSGGTLNGVTLTNASLDVAQGAAIAGVITGFASGDAIDLQNIGSSASITSAIVDGNTEITITGGSAENGTESFIFAGEGAAYALSTDGAGTGEDLTLTTPIPQITSFTAGDIVIGLIGDGNDSGYYTDNQAAPIVLEEIDPTTGVIVGEMTLRQQTVVVDGVTEYEISGEYGSSSEGTIQLAANGQSIVIAGYGINAATFNSAAQGTYGNAAGDPGLAQTGSLTDQTSYTPVARVVADISYNGTVDTSTALYNVYNTNNPRSVTTVNGTVFYLSGQGVKGDTTQGVFTANDGASSATAIYTGSDTRDVEIYNGQLYMSADSTQGADGIYSFGGLPTGTQAPTVLNGINTSITLTAAEENSVNAGAVGTQVDLDPENFFFANGTTLYIADGGQPKDGTIGDGGLQKWSLNTSTGVWHLDYTLSAGLDLVDNANVSNDTDGTAGIIGLAGQLNANGTVTFYTTNETIADLDQTYVYTITDTVSATTAAAGESFSVVYTAGADTNVRGVVEAPSAPVSIEMTSGETTSAGLVISGGSTLTVDAGGAASAVMILSGGSATITGTDTDSTIVEGGGEIVVGSASGDQVYGTQFVGGSVGNEGADYGGLIDVAAGGSATGVTVNAGGTLEVLAGGSATGITLSGGTLELGAGAEVTQVLADFVAGDAVDFAALGSASVLTSAVVDGNTVLTVTSAAVSQSVTLAGQFAPGSFGLIADGAGGVDLEIMAQTLSGTETLGSGVLGDDITVASGAVLTVAAGGEIDGITVLSGGSLVVYGTDPNVVIEAGGSATIYGTATGYLVEGAMTVYGAVSGVTISNGSLTLESGATATNLVIDGGDMTDAAAGIEGTLTFTNWGDLTETGTLTSGQFLVSGFTAADEIDLAAIGSGATLTSATSGGNTIITVAGGSTQTGSDSITFTGTGTVFELITDYGKTGEDLVISGLPSSVTSIYSGESTPAGYVVSGGQVLDVLNGGIANGVTILANGSANLNGTDSGLVISLGGNATVNGAETSATILAGANETMLGTATGDAIWGTQLVSAGTAVVTGEIVYSGGNLDLFLKGGIASATTVEAGGALNISGNATATNTVLSGGVLDLESPKATLTGSVMFTVAGSEIEESSLISAGYGDLAVLSGFNAGDLIDLTAIGQGATLSQVVSGGNTVLTVTGGSTETGAGKTSQVFIMAGTGVQYALQTDASGTGEEIVAVVATPTISTVTGSLVSGSTLTATGTGTAGDLVTLSNGASGTVAGNGTFSINFTAAEGIDSLTATQTDAVDDVSSASAAYGFDVAPVAPTIDGTVTQAVSGGAIVVTGTGGDGDTVTLYADGGTAPVGSAVVVNGSYSITTNVGISEGSHDLTATETDGAGLTSTAGSATEVVDAGPTTTLGEVVVAHNAVTDLTRVIDGLITPGISGDAETIVAVTGNATLDDGKVTYTSGDAGSDSFCYTVEDQYGTEATGTVDVTVDSGPSAVADSLTTGHGQSVNLTTLIDSLIQPGLTSDSLSIVSVTGGSVSLSNGTYTDVASASGSQVITYTVEDQYGDTASNQITVTADPGPLAAADSLTTGHGQSVNLTTLIDSLIQPGLTGDSLSIVSVTGGSVTLSNGTYTDVASASGSQVITYTVEDQYGDTASNQITVTADPGPLAAAGSVTVGHGQSVNISSEINSLVTPGVAGDQITIVSVSGGSVSLSNDTYTDAAGASGTQTISYEVEDQYGDTATNKITVTADPGPKAVAGSVTEGHNQSVNLTSVIDALVTPGISGDQITIISVSGGGASLSNGVVTDTTGGTGSQTISYEVEDQYGDMASNKLTVTADPGPKTTTAKLTENLGTSTNLTSAILADIKPGFSGDTLTIISVNGSATLGSVSLVNGKVEYTASGSGLANIPANGSAADSFTYVVEDQHGDTATGTVDLRVDNPAITVRGTNPAGHNVLTGTGVTTDFIAPGTYNTITTNGGNDIVNAGSGYDTVIATTGDVQVILAGTHNSVTGGTGSLSVTDTTGGYNTITLGSGNDVVAIVGSHNVLDGGTGTNTISFETGDNEVVLHSGGDDLITGMTLTGGDWFSVANLLSAAGLSSSVNTDTELGNFLHVVTNGGNTSLVFNATGNWSQPGATIATLDGVKASFNQMASAGMFHF